MSLSRPISNEDLYLLPLVKLITCVGRDLMFWVFTYGCPNKDPNNNLKEYLLQIVGITPSIFKKYFNKTQVEQIMINPACDQFDVPLLFLTIKIACDHNIADKDSPDWYTQDYNKLEYLLKLLKDERNDLLHNLRMRTKAELNPKIDELRNLLIKIVELTSDRFGLDSSQRQKHLTELNHFVDKVRDQPLTETEILQYTTLWRREYIENTLKDSGAAELKEMFKKLDHINPLSFMEGYDSLISLQSVFFQLLLEHQDQFNKKTQVEVNEMFKCSSVDLCSVIMVLGSAGAGKTILTKWLMLQWSKNMVQVQGLAEYDLVVPLECWSNTIDSLTKLVRSLLLNTCPKLGQDIITYIHNLKILYILDGVDKMNAVSRKVVDEIFLLSKTRQHTILCTSRPEKGREFLPTVPDQYQKCIFNIVGIPHGKQEGFVRMYHDHLIQLGKSVQNTDNLVHFVNKPSHLQELYKCPLILMFVVYLWACQPNKLNNNTTDTKLYKLLYNMLEEKLRQRLATQAAADNRSGVDLHEKLKELLECFSVEALLSVDQHPGVLPSSSQKRLKSQFVHDDRFLLQDFISTFTVNIIANKDKLCFLSNDCHDYFAAQGLMLAIREHHYFQRQQDAVLGQSITNNILERVCSNHSDLVKHRNILRHLVRLLKECEVELEDDEALNICQIIEKTGVTTPDAWLAFMAEVNCVQVISNVIALIFFSDSNHLVIRSCDVGGMISLLPHLSPDLLTLDLAGDLDDLPHLDHLLEVIAQKDCNVVVKHWRNLVDPDVTNITDHQLLRLCRQDTRCRMVGAAHVGGAAAEGRSRESQPEHHNNKNNHSNNHNNTDGDLKATNITTLQEQYQKQQQQQQQQKQQSGSTSCDIGENLVAGCGSLQRTTQLCPDENFSPPHSIYMMGHISGEQLCGTKITHNDNNVVDSQQRNHLSLEQTRLANTDTTHVPVEDNSSVGLARDLGAAQSDSLGINNNNNKPSFDSTENPSTSSGITASRISVESGLEKHLIHTKTDAEDQNNTKVLSIGRATGKPTKCVLLMGETGGGKTTFINAAINYLYNINFENNYRYCVEDRRSQDRCSTQSQTDFITVYKIHHSEGMRHDCDFVLIDTPGLADTRGEEQQSRITSQLEDFFVSDLGIDDLHCLGLVAIATINRVSRHQKDIVDEIKSLLGKHIPDITNIIATHATENPKVDQVLAGAGVQFSQMFDFDNYALFAPHKLNENLRPRDRRMLPLRWENMIDQYSEFFAALLKAKPVSVKILREKKRLDISRRTLGDHVAELAQLLTHLGHLEEEMSKYKDQEEEYRHYEQEREVAELITTPTMPGSHAHNCSICGQTCKLCPVKKAFGQIVATHMEEYRQSGTNAAKRPGAKGARGLMGMAFGGVVGVGNALPQTLNKNKACPFYDHDICLQCGHSFSAHVEENETKMLTSTKQLFVNDSMKTLFDEAVSSIYSTTEKMGAISEKITIEKEQTVEHFLNMTALIIKIQNLSPEEEYAKTLLEPLTISPNHDADHNTKASKIWQALGNIALQVVASGEMELCSNKEIILAVLCDI